MPEPNGVNWFQTIVSNLSDAIILIDLRGTIFYCSPSVEKVLGHRPEDLIGASYHTFCPDEGGLISQAQSDAGRVSSKGESIKVKCLGRARETRETEIRINRLTEGSGLEGVMLEIHDISKRLEAEERFRLSFETSPDAIAITTVDDGTYVAINQGFVDMSEYQKEEIVGHSSLKVHIWPNEKERDKLVIPLRRDGLAVNQEITYKTKTGKLKPGLISAKFIEISGKTHIISITKDIHALKQAEEKRFQLEKELQQAQKMEAIGRLAGGIAHDFNNLLTVILGNVEVAKWDMLPEHTDIQAFTAIEDAAKRAALLTSQLLAFSRKQDLSSQPLCLKDLWQKTNHLLQNSLREDIHLDCQIDEDLWAIESAPTQMELILMNLFVNAKDAMPGGGTLKVRIKNDVSGPSVCHTCGARYTGKGVRIIVEDTGIGIAQDTVKKIFEPFFTTKDLNKGTGLGLSTVFGIVTKAKGHIQVQSEPGRGTRFDLWFPALTEKATVQTTTSSSESIKSGKELLWVIEDDDMVRNTTCHTLKGAGYTVRVAARPTIAKAWIESDFEKPALVLCDVVMPEMKGPELIDFYQNKGFDLNVLFVSGYPRDMLHGDQLLRPTDSLLPKPFSPRELLETVYSQIHKVGI